MIESFDEKALLAGARNFDEGALGAIYDHLSPKLYRYAYRLLGDADLAEECVADTFTRFLHALRRGGGPRKQLKAYLYRSAHNWIVDRYRSSAPPTSPLDPQIADRKSPQPGELVQALERQDRLRAALFKLTPDQRQVIVLKYLEDFSIREAAQALDKTEGAVKSLQHRALANLRQILGNAE